MVGVYMKNVALTFTSRGRGRVLREGGSGDWTADPFRVSNTIDYVVCCQNTNQQRKGNDWGEISHKHGQAFIVGKLSKVVLKKPDEANQKKRYFFMFSEYAEIEVDDMWGGDRFPVRYLSESDLPFDINSLEFKSMPKFESMDQIFTLAEAKIALAKANNIEQSHVRILL